MRKTLQKAVDLFLSNPSLFLYRIFLEIVSRVRSVPKKSVMKNMNGVVFELNPSLDEYERQMFFGMYENGVVHAMEKILKKGDVFIDIGASIGYHSAIAAGLVGRKGKIYAFEPSPDCFTRLKKFRERNGDFDITVENIAAGDFAGKAPLRITKGLWYHTFLPGLEQELVSGLAKTQTTVEVPMVRLDEYIERKRIPPISLIKIDVEGYEFSVLRGLEKFFRKGQHPPIICEISLAASRVLGYEINDLLNYMKHFSYTPFQVFHFSCHPLSPSTIKRYNILDVLFLERK